MGNHVQILSRPSPFNMGEQWYEFASPDHFWMQWRFAILCDLLDGLRVGSRVAEVGCGNGVARRQLEGHLQVPIIGIDLNEAALELAEEGEGALYVYNIHDRRQEWDNFFTCIFLLDTLEHIEAPVDFLVSIRAHMSPGAFLVVNVPALDFLYSRYDSAAGHVKRYSKRLLAEELERAGFRIVKSSYWGLMMLPVALLRKIALRFVSRNRIIQTGFEPRNRFTDGFLRGLMRAERCTVSRPFLGTSLAAIAQATHGTK